MAEHGRAEEEVAVAKQAADNGPSGQRVARGRLAGRQPSRGRALRRPTRHGARGSCFPLCNGTAPRHVTAVTDDDSRPVLSGSGSFLVGRTPVFRVAGGALAVGLPNA